MGTMAFLLLPAMPGGGTADTAVRIRLIADHPWLFRLGWFPWQLTALSDLLIGIGLVRTRFIPKAPAFLTLLVTIAAVIADQAGQVAWMTRGVELAQAGDPVAYVLYQERVFGWSAFCGGWLYTIGALGWTWCLVAGGTWNGWLTWVSAVVWPIFLYVNATPFLPAPLQPGPAIVSIGNAVGFVL